jgi:HSP20 family protein
MGFQDRFRDFRDGPERYRGSVKDRMLTISGEKKVEKEETESDYHRVERSYGCFCRSISLPDTEDIDKVKSS